MSKSIAALCAVLLLAGCGEQGGTAGGSALASGAGKPSSGSLDIQPVMFAGPLRPGLYRLVQTGDVADETTRCITAAQIGRKSYIEPGDLQEGWRVVSDSMTRGRIDVEAAGPDGAKMVFDGNYAVDRFTIDAVMTFQLDGKSQRLTNRLVGTYASADCGGDSAADADS